MNMSILREMRLRACFFMGKLILKFETKMFKIFRGLPNRLRRDEKGTTAVEFGLVAFPFIMSIFGIVEMALMFTAGSLIEGATGSAARLIRTGQLQQMTSGNPESVFLEALCDHAGMFVDCNEIVYDVQSVPDGSFFTASAMTPTYDGDGDMLGTSFSTGNANDIVLVRVFYRYNLMTPLISTLLGGEDQSITFMSTVVLRTEPYEFEAG